MSMGTTSRVVIYRRVSTTEQADTGLGLAAQSTSIAATVADMDLVADLVDEAMSGSVDPMKRPALAEALDMLATGEADTLVVAKLDRATRSVADLCTLLDLSDRQGWRFVALDLGIDTGSPMGRAMAQMAGVFSELERKMIGQRTKDAMSALKASGVRLGRPVELPDDVRYTIASKRKSGQSLRTIADDFNRKSVPTARGGDWHASTVAAVLRSLDLDAAAA